MLRSRNAGDYGGEVQDFLAHMASKCCRSGRAKAHAVADDPGDPLAVLDEKPFG